MRTRLLVAAALLLAASSSEAFVRCRTADGKVYFGNVPPPGCQVQGEYSDAPPVPAIVDGPPVFSSGDVTLDAALEMSAPENSAEDTAREIALRRSVPAVQLVDAYDQVYANVRFLEGRIANGADFPVYNVKVCANGSCRMARPPNLQPGAHGVFTFPVGPSSRADGLKPTWDVTPSG